MMKIVVATPLFPPEIADPAPYVKELAGRLAGRYRVTVVAYAHLPERVAGVEILTVDKRRPLPVRLAAFTRALLSATRGADLIYAVNGASVELPAAIASLLSGKPLVFGIADPAAHRHARRSLLFHIIERIALGHSYACIKKLPLARPEILPFAPRPSAAQAAYEASWQEHLATLDSAFSHART